jgi:hypothetical protein
LCIHFPRGTFLSLHHLRQRASGPRGPAEGGEARWLITICYTNISKALTDKVLVLVYSMLLSPPTVSCLSPSRQLQQAPELAKATGLCSDKQMARRGATGHRTQHLVYDAI